MFRNIILRALFLRRIFLTPGASNASEWLRSDGGTWLRSDGGSWLRSDNA